MTKIDLTTSSLLHPRTARQFAERCIISVLVDDLLAAGFHMDVNDNDGDRETHYSGRDKDAIMLALFHNNIDAVDWVLDLDLDRDHPCRGDGFFVRLVTGNDGWDVISDYSLNLDRFPGLPLGRADALAQEIDAAGVETWVIDRLLKLETGAIAANAPLLALGTIDHDSEKNLSARDAAVFMLTSALRVPDAKAVEDLRPVSNADALAHELAEERREA